MLKPNSSTEQKIKEMIHGMEQFQKKTRRKEKTRTIHDMGKSQKEKNYKLAE